ncbi:Aste57867_12739 [Aphanomyces stellatus]|uniref:Aste57867_12739 protein n=1 Tax=Aphanomyces stellatus TaxID=120398 RepID=A0A485KWS9_9STRA|nr:hypothetical protein As57867_012691 [Aphanomyces stellatus]VFT89589.1 Aste57867_12739 [Aphanomyces stellatus]
MALDELPWAPFFVMLTVGGATAFFLDLLVAYLSYSFATSPWFFLGVGTLFMACIDEITKYITYISSVRRDMKEELSRPCICWLMARAAAGYSLLLTLFLVIYVALYSLQEQLRYLIPFILLDIVNNISCSALSGVWLYVRKHHKHSPHPTAPTRLEETCMDSVIGPAICIRYIYYIAAFSFIFMDGSTTHVLLYIGVNVVYALCVGVIVAISFYYLDPDSNSDTAATTAAADPSKQAAHTADTDVVFADGSRA